MVKQLFSAASDFVILIIAAVALFIFKNQITHVGVWAYELAWVVVVASLIATILLKPKKTKVAPAFPRELAKRIENALSHDAIKLYHSWLLMSLDNCYRIYQQKQSKEALSELANDITDKLVFTINRVPKERLYKLLEERNKDNAFIALIFFTTLIKTLEPKAIKAIFKKPISAYRDVFTLIQLNNAPQFLFREHYRLYELGALVGYQWQSLNFNSDIEQQLRSTLEPQLLEDKRQVRETSTKTDANASPMPESKDETQCHQINENPEQEEKTSPVAVQAIVEVEPQNAENTNSIETEQCDKFFKWLQRQIIRKPINEAHYFYQNDKQHGANRIFITEAALADFSKKTQVSTDEILKSLVLLSHSDGKTYQLNVEGEGDKTLIFVAIDFDVKVSSDLNGTILEAS